MRIIRRYIARQVVVSILLVLAALVMLFAFFDLILELKDVGREGYRLGGALVYTLLTVPSRLYELFPVAVLIGTLIALAQMVIHSEYAVMRTSGVSILGIGGALARVGFGFAVLAFVTGEFLTPLSEEAAQRLRLSQTTSVVAQQFRSGLWVKDDQSFVNVVRVLHDATLQDIKIYEFDENYHLRTISLAREGKYLKDNVWNLHDVVRTRFEENATSVERSEQVQWRSVLTPGILSVLLVAPEKMSLLTLASYVQHLRENKQNSARYEIALWTKVVYPLGIVVMMLLALPFAYLNVREGGVSTKIFAGIMLGLAFHLLSRLFGHVGQLAAWPPLLAAFAPTVLFLALAVMMIRRLERR
jgi:lipopolysaccharide export system permease protein